MVCSAEQEILVILESICGSVCLGLISLLQLIYVCPHVQLFETEASRNPMHYGLTLHYYAHVDYVWYLHSWTLAWNDKLDIQDSQICILWMTNLLKRWWHYKGHVTIQFMHRKYYPDHCHLCWITCSQQENFTKAICQSTSSTCSSMVAEFNFVLLQMMARKPQSPLNRLRLVFDKLCSSNTGRPEKA